MQRFGSVIRVREEMLTRYKELHANPWPEVEKTIKDCNIQNYSIYYWKGYLFSYYEYVGDDYESDMKKMAADPATQRWWKETDPCQLPVEGSEPGDWWTVMEEVFYLK